MLVAFIGMQLFGITANLMSLGAIDFGMIVDGAVVMIENSVRAAASAAEHEHARARINYLRRCAPRHTRSPAPSCSRWQSSSPSTCRSSCSKGWRAGCSGPWRSPFARRCSGSLPADADRRAGGCRVPAAQAHQGARGARWFDRLRGVYGASLRARPSITAWSPSRVALVMVVVASARWHFIGTEFMPQAGRRLHPGRDAQAAGHLADRIGRDLATRSSRRSCDISGSHRRGHQARPARPRHRSHGHLRGRRLRQLKPHEEWTTAQHQGGADRAHGGRARDRFPASSTTSRSRWRCGWTK